MDTLGLLGRILSHGYILCGYLPVHIVFPSLCAMLLGSNVKVPADILVDSFKEYLPEIDRMHLQQCFTSRSEISMELKSALVSIFSRFGCLEVPTASNILRLCEQVAMYEFLIKPMAAINAISSGIASEHREFWNSMSVHDFHDLYLALTANPLKIIQLIEEPCFTDPTQEKVFNFLLAFIGTMRADEVQRFLIHSSKFLAFPTIRQNIPIFFHFHQPIKYLKDVVIVIESVPPTLALSIASPCL